VLSGVDLIAVVRPVSLKKVGSTESMVGSYLPHWGFDDRTTTDYTGQRGDHYYTTETYTTQENGQTVTNTRQVQHTAWSHASGRVSRDFTDVLATGVNTPDATCSRSWDRGRPPTRPATSRSISPVSTRPGTTWMPAPASRRAPGHGVRHPGRLPGRYRR